MTPVQILEEWCLANGITVPEYSSDGKRASVNDDMFVVDEFGKFSFLQADGQFNRGHPVKS